MSRDLSSEMTNLSFKFKSELSSVTEDYPRWHDCVLTSGYLAFAVGYMYVKKHFSDEAKVKVIQSNIKTFNNDNFFSVFKRVHIIHTNWNGLVNRQKKKH